MGTINANCDGNNCGSLIDNRAPAIELASYGLIGGFWRVLVWMVDHAERQRTRAFLSELSDSQLDDIGLTPEQARREAAQPFWR